MNATVYIIFIAISCLASFSIYLQKDSKFYLRLFPLFLILTLIVETISNNLHSHGKSTIVLYNFFSCIEFLFYMYVLREIVQSQKSKKIIFHTTWIYILLVVLNYLFIQKITSFLSVTYAVSCLLITITCIYYFFELFQTSHSVNLARQPAFWICSGLLFFYCCSFPIYGLLNILKKLPPIIQKNLGVIVLLLNVFLYSSFTIAFLCRIRARNST